MCAAGTCMRGMHGPPSGATSNARAGWMNSRGRTRMAAALREQTSFETSSRRASVGGTPFARARAAGVMIHFFSTHEQSVQGGVHRGRGPRTQNDQNPRHRTYRAGRDAGGPLRQTDRTHMRDAGPPGPLSRDDGSSRTPCPRCQAREATLLTRTERSVSLRCRLCGKEWTLPDRRAGDATGGRGAPSAQTEKPQRPPPGSAGGISDGES
jgi:hypothetical protein